ncbi:MAG: nuclear transport factor 2 family protein [Candidatus Aminicenantes bacterium]|nr:MAG: nuclear transport factor 2 family protein [Candidatus Aminicenantes bacterium]
MRKVMLVLLMVLVLWTFVVGEDTSKDDKERSEIKAVIENAYIQGVHIKQEPEAMKKGFHPEFNMLVLKDGEMTKVPINQWIEKVKESKKNPGPSKVKTTYRFSLIDVTGNAAVAKIEVYKDSIHVFTDYMSLYKFKEGWKIVNKIFHRFQ